MTDTRRSVVRYVTAEDADVVVGASGSLSMSSAEQLARAGDEAARAGRHAEALVLFERVLDGFGAETELDVRRWVAWALECKACALADVGSLEEVVTSRDESIARFGRDSDEYLLDRVSFAFDGKARALRRLGRFDEALRVRDEEIARYAGVAPPGLPLSVIEALEGRALVLGDLSRWDEVMTTCDELLALTAASSQPETIAFEAWALFEKGVALRALGDHGRVLVQVDELFARFGDSTEGDVRRWVAHGLVRKARSLETLDRVPDAIDAFDAAIDLLEGSDDPERLELRFDTLVDKGMLLWRAQRGPEAAVVFESAVTAYRDLEAVQTERDIDALGRAVLVMVHRLFCVADPATASQIAEQLTELLGDVVTPPVSPCRTDQLPEAQIAARLAELWNSEPWIEFVTASDDDETLASMAGRALDIYRETSGWLSGLMPSYISDAHDGPAVGAVLLLRQFADGYALLARRWSQSARAQLSLPSQLLMESAMREADVPEWAEEHGHPLVLSEREELGEDLVEDMRREGEKLEPAIATTFLVYVRLYELLEVLCDSPTGHAAMQTRELKSSACQRLAESRSSAGWVWTCLEDAIGVGTAQLQIAEAYFVATHGAVATSRELFPSREVLRDVLDELDAHEWLETQEIQLPSWLEPAAE
jgi:tetratricopeptide (TPR) repeat protein